MQKKIFFILLIPIFLSAPYTRVYAETRVTADTIYQDQKWVRANSPYILNTDVWISKGVTLTIEPGVTVTSATTSGQTGGPLDEPYSFGIGAGGTLKMLGSASQPIIMSGLGLIVGTGVNIVSNHVNFTNTLGIDLSTSTVSMSTTTITGANIGLALRGSRAVIDGSTFKANRYGIRSFVWSSGPVLVENNYDMARESESEIGGEGNAINTPLNPSQNIIYIRNSVFEGNRSYGVQNSTVNEIDARGNWWGAPTGPRLLSTGAGDRISGLISTSPWLTSAPDLTSVPEEPAVECCSSVIFFPGLQASRLYKDEEGILGMTKNRLWEPNRNLDVEKLYMDGDGQSIDPAVYVDGVVDEALGFEVYDSFIDMMDDMVSDGTIAEWSPQPYDWRKSVSDIMSDELVARIESIAERSKTGKVSVVAHSNGGIVAKLLADKLGKSGKSDLIDTVILVASPELGTPQAIAGVLHGDNQSIAGGLILSADTARELGRNMPGAYGLLPSRAFMDNFLKPIVVHADSGGDVTGQIYSYDSLRDFLLGRNDDRTDPEKSDLKTPTVLKESILSMAETVHQMADHFRLPGLPQVISLIGWGRKTLQSISYSPKGPSYNKTLAGDGTVHLLARDQASHDKELFFNIGGFNKNEDKDIAHADIMEAKPVLDAIKKELTDDATGATLGASGDLVDDLVSDYISAELPSVAYRDDDIRVGVHSPASIDLYDSTGRHTGFIDSGLTDSDLLKKEERVPGSSIDIIGGSDGIGGSKYISVSPEEGEEYKFRFSGTGVGAMTVDVARRVDGEERPIIEYVDIPVTPYMSAEMAVPASFVDSDATSTLSIAIDVDGDSSYDINIHPGQGASSTMVFLTLRAVVDKSIDDQKIKDYLNRKIDNIEKQYEKGKLGRVVEEMRKLESKTSLGHFAGGNNGVDADAKKIVADAIAEMLDILEVKK